MSYENTAPYFENSSRHKLIESTKNALVATSKIKDLRHLIPQFLSHAQKGNIVFFYDNPFCLQPQNQAVIQVGSLNRNMSIVLYPEVRFGTAFPEDNDHPLPKKTTKQIGIYLRDQKDGFNMGQQVDVANLVYASQLSLLFLHQNSEGINIIDLVYNSLLTARQYIENVDVSKLGGDFLSFKHLNQLRLRLLASQLVNPRLN